ncbi:MAG: amidohydrolase family protein [Gemmatimonadetes bacterium]|nr:amidohydrolase family protein [Gemmatimonadota bacterium]MCA9762241.1 amidohydrolase family protein [Gemmatimonadota bacterium]HPF60970.1 amidohydrolase family protein [Gemmatimonadales bacterium]
MLRTLGSCSLALVLAAPVAAQRIDQLGDFTKRFVSVTEPVVALTGVTVLDGTGAAARRDQVIVLREGRIAAVGAAGDVAIPAGARVMPLAGHTVIPGIVGMHDHMFYTAPGGRRVAATVSSTRLYLASGVTTIRTTGSNAPYQDINVKAQVDRGEVPGPRIHVTAPYVTGGGGGYMAEVHSPEQARRFVAYWGEEGATWVKAYTTIRGEDLKAAIEEAHRRGMKVTGHLCSVSFQEAVALGIDNLEHGLFTASDFDPGRVPDECSGSLMAISTRSENASPDTEAWRRTIEVMIRRGVPMTSTLAVYEMAFPGRGSREPRMFEAMAPEVREAYLAQRKVIDENPNPVLTTAMLHNAMAFEKAFHDAGGLLAAGVDPTGIGGALPGFGDQRNYELLLEAGFTPAQVVRIMTLNGARILGIEQDLGTIEVGKLADLVVLEGDLTADGSVIQRTRVVFKDGVGYDPAPLIASVKGRVGII